MGVIEGQPTCQESVPELPGPSGASGGAPGRNLDRSQELAEICRDHHASMVRFLSIRTGSTEDAKEILQEAYARVLALERPGTISLLAGYLWRSAVNLAMDRKRKRTLQERMFRSTVSLAETREVSAEVTVESRERLAIVERAIGELPPRCLEGFVLHVLNGLTFEEVGHEMRISARMAQKHVARALEYLQSCLDTADGKKGAR
jgi:RNA polymerase sigma factor (sigma-70 family)